MNLPTPSSDERLADLTERAIEALRTVYDPEVPANIYDLGLIYKIDLAPIPDDTDERWRAHVDMTLTTANCPLADMIPGMVYDALVKIPDFKEVTVNLVWDPPWDPSRMSEDARFALDMY